MTASSHRNGQEKNDNMEEHGTIASRYRPGIYVRTPRVDCFFCRYMQQGFQITAKSIQAMDIGKAIIFSDEGEKAAFAYAKEPPPDDGKTKAQRRKLPTKGVEMNFPFELTAILSHRSAKT